MNNRPEKGPGDEGPTSEVSFYKNYVSFVK